MLAGLMALPTAAARLGERQLRRAVSNATSAADAIARQREQRRRLAPTTTATAAGIPGELVRLTREECLELLRSKRIGRLGYVESARALDVVPVNYVVDDDGVVTFRTGPGPKLSSADRRDVVAFEVDDIDEETHTGWSVLVVGRARRLSTDEQPDVAQLPSSWVNGPRHQLVSVTPTRIEGRCLN